MDADMKLRLQRAGLMAIITGIFTVDNDTPLRNVKIAAAGSFSDMIDLGAMVGDEIDVMVARAIQEYLESEKAVIAANELLSQESKN